MNRVETFLAKRWLESFSGRNPQMKNALDWLNDPMRPGRKRGIAAAMMVLSGALRGAGEGIKEACERALLDAGGVCSFNYAGTAQWIGFGSGVVYDVLVPGATVVGVIFGIWGLLDAKRKGKVLEEKNRIIASAANASAPEKP